MFCTKCGKPTEQGASFCTSCGEQISVEVRPSMETSNSKKGNKYLKVTFIITTCLFVVSFLLIVISKNYIDPHNLNSYQSNIFGCISGLGCLGVILMPLVSIASGVLYLFSKNK